MRNWLQANSLRFLGLQTPDINPLEYHVWTVLKNYHKLHPKPKTTDELEVALQSVWNRACEWSVSGEKIRSTLKPISIILLSAPFPLRDLPLHRLLSRPFRSAPFDFVSLRSADAPLTCSGLERAGIRTHQ